jgi:hydrogenase maturation protease
VSPQILVAGIGNIFLGDDAFGCEAVRLLAREPLPDNVVVVDYGIRGFDLALALAQPYAAFILVDAAPRGEAPGTLFVLEVDATGPASPPRETAVIEPHAMNPLKVLGAARAMGANPRNVFVVGCEPSSSTPDEEERMGLSAPVQASLSGAVALIHSVIDRITNLVNSPQGEQHGHVSKSSSDYGGGRSSAYGAA